MPTPSSHRDNDSLAFNSTCPDEQAPHPQSGWSRSQLPYDDERARTEDTGSNGSSGSSDTITVDATTPSTEPSPASPQSVTMTPGLDPANEEPATLEVSGPLFLGSGSNDIDDDAKPAEPSGGTEENTMMDELRDGSNDAAGHTGRRNTSQAWGPIGVHQALRQQFGIGNRISNTRSAEPSFSPVMDEDKPEEQAVCDEYGCDYGWDDCCQQYIGHDPTARIVPVPTSPYLRAGSCYVGTQQSERQEYDVQVELKYVDLRESFMCGYLRIQGLTEDHPSLTTYFEGEIIGSKYGFATKNKEWGASERIDLSHWAKFPPFQPFMRQAKRGHVVMKEYLQKEFLFMRWKEQFLVPDHRVKTINGASFEGFYYICFNQLKGIVNGIYFHAKSEKFQHLELRHVENRGCMSSLEFR